MKTQNFYTIGFEQASSQQLKIEVRFENIINEKTIIQLPSWRPGRYEIGNFAKNISQLKCHDSQGQLLKAHKISKDSWEVHTLGCKSLIVNYQYFAAELNAGSSYLDAEQLYVNPVNCCVYIPERIEESLSLFVAIPDDYELASGMQKSNEKNTFHLPNFDALADQPFIASASLQKFTYSSGDTEFYIWFQGNVLVDEKKLLRDFKKFTDLQIQTMEDFPVGEFHFLIQACSFPYYHGVEHQYSTVLALGPDHQLFTSFYDELLGVSSHELFHAWNVKFIRPAEMFPYDFTKENYSALGYVYEGITTYYGDIFLYRSGVFNKSQYLSTFNEYLKRHYLNYGRKNYSVAESSFDTWLDGYVQGVPHRKVSIYAEGCLIAFMLDGIIRQKTNHLKSLDDLLRALYAHAKAGKAYDEKLLITILKQLCDYDFETFFEKYIHGCEDFSPLLHEYIRFNGFEVSNEKYLSNFEHQVGLILNETNGQFVIQQTAPDSPALVSGLLGGDQIIAVNGMKFSRKWLNNPLTSHDFEITVFSKDVLKTYLVAINDALFYAGYSAI